MSESRERAFFQAVGHADHFLSRLQRLEARDVEVALGLYRDTGIVLEVVARAGPPAAERVALALGTGPGGPHLVVTARGDFVTCLGPGMKTGRLRVIPRAVLDAVVQRRRREEVADRLAGGEGRGHHLLDRLGQPQTLSREEFSGMLAYAPALVPTLLEMQLQNVRDTGFATSRCAARGRPPPEAWRQLWTVTQLHGHLAALAGGLARSFFEILPENDWSAADFVAFGAVRFGHLPSVARGLWATARLGKGRLGRAKQLRRGQTSVLCAATSFLELAVLGLAQAKLRAEARKALEQHLAGPNEAFDEWSNRVRTALVEVLDDAQTLADEQLVLGRELCVQRGADLPARSPYHFGSAADVPEPLARAATVTAPLNIWTPGGEGWGLLMVSLPFLARAAAEDLYLPRAALHAWGLRDYSLKVAQAHLKGTFDADQHPVPLRRATPRPSPNGPCTCGSGLKQKRCCGRG